MRAVYLANAAEAARVQNLIDRDIFPLDVAGLPASCNRTATIVVKRINRWSTHARAVSVLYHAAISRWTQYHDRDAIITMQHSKSIDLRMLEASSFFRT